MPVYTYKAIDLDERFMAGEVAADTPRQARDILRGKGLTIQAIEPRQAAAKGAWRRPGRRRRTDERVTTFIRDLSTLLGAGIPLLEAVDTLIAQSPGGFRGMLLALRERVAAGSSLAEAMEAAGGAFDELAVSIVRVGETAGTLEFSLGKLADFKEHAQKLRGRVATALLYPGIVLTVGLAVMIFLMTFVVPQLLGTLKESGRELPGITKLVSSVSDTLIHQGWLILLALGAIAIGLRLAVRTAAGKRLWHRLILRLPLVGPLVRKETISRLAVVLAAMLRSGVVFVQALGVARRTMPNIVFQEAVARCEQAVTAGKDVAGPLEASGVFPPMVVQMLNVGQHSGELEAMLDRLATAYAHQVETATARLTAVLEPILILFLAVMVGSIAFATILPILEASNVL